MARLLFTGGGGAGNEALFRHLEGPHQLFFADAVRDAINPAIPAERRLEIPMANAPGFADTVLGLCADLAIDILVPGVDEELLHLAPHRDGTPRIMVPQHDFVAAMLDKYTFARHLAGAGLDVPETRLLADWQGMAFPLIAKPRSGRGSRSVSKLDHPDQIAAYLTLEGRPASEYIAQEMGQGDEYTVCVHADEEGRLSTVVPVLVGVKKGITLAATAIASDPIFAYAKAFQDAFRPRGIYNIQCMLDTAGRVLPFEVNPRVSTTFCLALQAGFDPFSAQDPHAPRCLPETAIHLRRHWVNAITQD